MRSKTTILILILVSLALAIGWIASHETSTVHHGQGWLASHRRALLRELQVDLDLLHKQSGTYPPNLSAIAGSLHQEAQAQEPWFLYGAPADGSTYWIVFTLSEGATLKQLTPAQLSQPI